MEAWAKKSAGTAGNERENDRICRLCPGENSIGFEWCAPGASFAVLTEEDGSPVRHAVDPREKSARFEGLKPESEYSLRVGEGEARLFRTGARVGCVVNYLHPADRAYAFAGEYVGSPSIVRLPSGALLAAHDVFGHGTPQDAALLFRSDDGGLSWRHVTEFRPCFWGGLFLRGSELYMLFMTTEYGALMLSRSDDEGESWREPVLLMEGKEASDGVRGPHKAPMPVLEAEGRLWIAVDYGAWSAGGHGNGLLSAGAKADLMLRESWSFTGATAYSYDWPSLPEGKSAGCLEGNALLSPEGEIQNFLRYEIDRSLPREGFAMVLACDGNKPDRPLVYRRVQSFPAGSSKFEIRYDKKTKRYLALSNLVTDDRPADRRTLVLSSSEDLRDWRVALTVADLSGLDAGKNGVQYPSFDFDGDDLVVLVRTALCGAGNFHDANTLTFHRVENYARFL